MKNISRIITTLLVTLSVLLTALAFNTGFIADPIGTPTFSNSDVFEAKVCRNTEGNNTVDLKPQEYVNYKIGWGEKIVATHRGFSFVSDMGPYAVQANDVFSLTAESSIADSEINQLIGIWMVDFIIRNSHILVTFFDSENYGKMFTLYPNECITVTSNTVSVPFDVRTSP